jgi:molybdopterin-guanine dinucleotide biosynthesis protein B
MVPVISFVGRSGAGKTTFLEKLISEMKCRGFRVGVIKHDSHGFEMDHPGKDTWRHAKAGADVVCIASAEKFAMIKRTSAEMSLDEVIARVDDVDIIFVEGYRNQGHRLVEIFRRDGATPPLGNPQELYAVVSDIVLYQTVPHFPVNDPLPLADVLEKELRESCR